MNKTRLNTIGIEKRGIGFPEMLIALLPILGAYKIGPAAISFWILLALDIYSIIKLKKIQYTNMKPLLVFIVYFLIHEAILVMIGPKGGSININYRIEQLTFLVSIILIVPILDMKKLSRSINIVAVISMVGLLYQVIIVFNGGLVHPIEIPGLVMSEHRLEAVSIRPSSFFMEPAAYANYMFAPIVIALIDRKVWWAALLIVFMFLTTSTTGIVAAFIIVGVFVIVDRTVSKRNIILIIISMLLLYGLTHLSIFETGMEKLESTEIESNVRTHQGPLIVSTMHFDEMIFGVRYGDASNYCESGRVDFSKVVFYDDGAVYMSSFWLLILRFGIVGLLLYLFIFFRVAKNCRETIPYVVVLLVTLFTGSMFIGVGFVYSVIILYVTSRQFNSKIITNDESSSY